jgi:hypothetical protein
MNSEHSRVEVWRYLMVAFIVMIDVPELVGPVPVARTEKVSGPLYPAFAVYS